MTWAPGTVHLPAQGLAVFRRDEGRLWVAVDYGHAGGGHGHPDRLNLLLADGATRWLDDMGTGTYVERALHWYRSTLAHQAPLVDGASQPGGDGRLVAIAEEGDLSGIVAAARPARGVEAVRTVVVDGTCVIDRLSWQADRDVVLDLPFHVDGEVPLPWEPVARTGAGGLEDGFDFLEDVERAPIDLAVGDALRLALRAPDGSPSTAALWLVAPAGAELWRARAPGPPGAGARRFHVVRLRARHGEVLAVVDPRGVVDGVVPGRGQVTLCFGDGTISMHRPPSTGDESGVWQLRKWRDARDLSVRRLALPHVAPQWEASPSPRTADGTVPRALPTAGVWTTTLAEPHYRRSEASWDEAGAPGAVVHVSADDDALHVDVDVALGRPPAFVPEGSLNALDNERPEVNGDGVQLHLATPAMAAAGMLAGWLLVPEVAGAVRAIPTAPAAEAIPVRAAWTPRADGYQLAVTVPRAALQLDDRDAAGRTLLLDVLVNEMPEGRERRRGQLVLSGAAGGFVYLQGDRHAAARCVPVVLPPPATR